MKPENPSEPFKRAVGTAVRALSGEPELEVTFSAEPPALRGLKARLRRLGKFQLICLAGVAINATLLNLQFNLLGMNRYLANAVAIAAVTGWNFWLNLKLSWRIAEPRT